MNTPLDGLQANELWNTRATTPESSAAQGAMGEYPLSDYQPGQWWHAELAGISGNTEPLTTQQFRAIWVARNLINAMFAAQPSDATAQPRVDLTDERAAIQDCIDVAQRRLLQPPSEFREIDFIVALGWIRDRLKELLANTAQGNLALTRDEIATIAGGRSRASW